MVSEIKEANDINANKNTFTYANMNNNNNRGYTLMKRILLATVIATSSFAYADSGLYTSLKAGVSDTKFEDYKSIFLRVMIV